MEVLPESARPPISARNQPPLARNRGQLCATAPGPKVFPGHSASAGVGDLLGSVVLGETRDPLGCREALQFPGHQPWDPGTLA